MTHPPPPEYGKVNGAARPYREHTHLAATGQHTIEAARGQVTIDLNPGWWLRTPVEEFPDVIALIHPDDLTSAREEIRRALGAIHGQQKYRRPRAPAWYRKAVAADQFLREKERLITLELSRREHSNVAPAKGGAAESEPAASLTEARRLLAEEGDVSGALLKVIGALERAWGIRR